MAGCLCGYSHRQNLAAYGTVPSGPRLLFRTLNQDGVWTEGQRSKRVSTVYRIEAVVCRYVRIRFPLAVFTVSNCM